MDKTLNSTLRQGLQSIKGIIRIKSLEHKNFIKHYIEASLINNRTGQSGIKREKRQLAFAAILSNLVFSGFQEIQITKLNKIVAEVQIQGAANYKRIGVLTP